MSTVQVDLTISVEVPDDAPDELPSQIVADALKTDERIYDVVEHVDRRLFGV